MKSLKKVPPGAKGLRKLPTAVRNKMGYMQKGGKVTKKMVDEEFTSNMNSSMNLTNELAKRASTGLKKNGFPMKPAAAKALKKEVARRKKQEQNAKPNYRYVGTKLPDGPAPFEDDGMPKAKSGMKAVKKYQKGGKVKKKKTIVNTDELGRRGSFNPYTRLTKGSRSPFAPTDSEYSKDYQNKMVGKYDREGGYKKKIGYQEERMRGADKADKVMGLRAEAYKARENKFGIKKPKAKVMKSGGKVVKYQGGGTIGPDQKKNKGRVKVQELPRNEQKKLGMKFRDESQLGRGKYEDFHSMNLYSATPEEALKYYKMNAAKKALKGKGITVGADVSPEKIMQMASQKVDMNAVNKMAKTSFMDWSADRRKNPKAYAGSYRGVGGAQRLKK